ncbi:MAG: alpha/beta fold hydrolase [Polyangiaceae bacterium]
MLATRRTGWLAAAFALALAGCGGGGDLFWVSSDGAEMPVWVRGNVASGKLVLFVHGGPGGSAIFAAEEPSMLTIQQDVGMAFWDQRGSGDSQGNASPRSLTLDQDVIDLGGVVQALHMRYPNTRVFLMGHSWGGAVSGAYLGSPASAGEVAGWIDVDGLAIGSETERLSRAWAIAKIKTLSGPDGSSSAAANWTSALAWYAQNQTITAQTIAQHTSYVTALGGYEDVPANDRGLGSLGFNLFTPFDGLLVLTNQTYDVQVATGASIVGTDLTTVLPQVSVPTLVLWGQDDGIIPLAAGQHAFSLIGTDAAQKSMVTLSGAAHVSFSDQPGPFAQAALKFIAATP